MPHQRLLVKLKACGIDGKVLDWIRSFLSERKQRVIIRGQASGWAPVSSGVPQGSVLGPTLFVAYINDMPDVVASHAKLFADDSKIYAVESRTASVERLLLQSDIDAVVKWSNIWQMAFNEEKCTVLHFGSARHVQYQYTMKGAPLGLSSVEKVWVFTSTLI